mgnify:CR=1 FL=1
MEKNSINKKIKCHHQKKICATNNGSKNLNKENQNNNLLKGIKYQIDNTAELVRNSNIVLLHQSTSFSFAVLFNKPVVFLTSNKLRNSSLGPRIDNFAKSVNGQIINMDNDLNKPLDLQNLLKIHHQ